MRPIVLAALLTALPAAATAAPPLTHVHKTTLQTSPFPGHGLHTVLVRTVVDPGAEVAPHTHPGLEMCYVVLGTAMVHIDGRPDTAMTQGDSYAAPAGVVHSIKNTGRTTLTLVSTYVVDASKPIASPGR